MGGETFKGRMDDLRIYKTALSERRIKRLAGFAESPTPSDGATGVSVDTQLSFSPNPLAASHDVYFGADNPPTTLVADNSTETTIDPCTFPLEYGLPYYWRVNENTPAGTVTGEVWTFTTFAPPDVTTRPATNPTKTSATLNGTLESLGDSASVDVRFEYGATAGGPYDHQTDLQSMTATGDFNIDITNLESGTTYYFRAAVYGQDNSYAYGDEQSLITFWKGSGTQGDPYLIGTSGQLQLLSENSGYWDPNIYFELIDDIVILPGLIIAPIGNNSTTFDGVFDGAGYSISGLIQSGSSYLGLFGKTGSTSVIGDLGVTNANITATGIKVGTTVTAQYIGILTGYNGGSLINCYSTGSVSADSSYSFTYSSTTVSNMGGLTGLLSNSSIDKCYSAGRFTAESVKILYDAPSSGTIKDLGGLVGKKDGSSTITDSYWDKQASGQTASAGGTGKTTVEMKEQATFGGWDFDTTWGIVIKQSYPYLLCQGETNCGIGVPYPVGDMNFDCVVNLLDWAIFCRHWLEDRRIKKLNYYAIAFNLIYNV